MASLFYLKMVLNLFLTKILNELFPDSIKYLCIYVPGYYRKDRVYCRSLSCLYDIYVTMGRFGIEILCLSMSNFHHIFSLYILSIDLLNKCQWHLILYILLLVLDSYNIMNHYFLYLFKWVPNIIMGPI